MSKKILKTAPAPTTGENKEKEIFERLKSGEITLAVYTDEESKLVEEHTITKHWAEQKKEAQELTAERKAETRQYITQIKNGLIERLKKAGIEPGTEACNFLLSDIEKQEALYLDNEKKQEALYLDIEKRLEKSNQELVQELVETREALGEAEKKLKKVTGTFRQPIAINTQLTKTPKPDLFSAQNDDHVRGEIAAYNESGGNQEETKIRCGGLDSLTAHEINVVTAFSILLDRKSQNRIQDAPNFYMGNTIQTGGIRGFDKLAGLCFTVAELAREIRGGKTPGGRDIEETEKVIEGLYKRKFTFETQVCQKTVQNGKLATRISRVTHEMPLIWEASTITGILVDGEKDFKSYARSKVLFLNPLFTHEIKTKYLNTPVDLIARTAAAYGCQRVPRAVLILRDKLRAWQCFGGRNGYENRWNEHNLFQALYPAKFRQKKLGDIRRLLNENFNIQVDLGLLECYPTIGEATDGGAQYIFTSPVAWPKF